jgi:short-chain fatty acids transporter
MQARLARIGARLTDVTIRWVPDAWVIAVLLTAFVWVLAVLVADAPLLVGDTGLPLCTEDKSCGAFDAWSGGIWRLLKLSSQFALALVAAQAVATSRPMHSLMSRLASLPNAASPRQAIVLMAAFSVVTGYLNWAVNLVMCATFVPIVAARNPKVDFRLLVASAYIGLGAIWHAGLSGSAPLISATPDNFLIKTGVLVAPIPVSETLFHPFNLVYVVLMGVFITAVAALLHPAEDDAKPLSVDKAEALLSSPRPPPDRAALSPAQRLDHSRLLSLLVGAGILAHLGVRFAREGANGWDINGYNAAFLGLGLVLHDSPRTFLDACEQGARNAWGIIVQFPLYAGIFGLMQLTPLAMQLTEQLSALGGPASYPSLVYVMSSALNYLVPSGGSQWVIEAPYILAAGAKHGLSDAMTTLAFAYGDMSSNFIQPFWAIPLLSVTAVSFGEIMGYCLMLFGACFGFTMIAVALMPALF